MKKSSFIKNNLHSQSGVVGLIVLLSMVVLITVAISAISRSTVSTQITTQQQESSEVFTAAELAVDKALSEIFSTSAVESVSVEEEIDGIATKRETVVDNVLETRLNHGTTAELILAGNDPINEDIVIEWWKGSISNCNDDNPASIIASIYHKEGGNISARHYAFGDSTCSASRGDNFEGMTESGSDGYLLKKTWNITSLGLHPGDLLRIKPAYNDTEIRVSGPIDEAQYNVRVDAMSDEKQASKAITVKQTLPAAPTIMDFSLVSGGPIVQE